MADQESTVAEASAQEPAAGVKRVSLRALLLSALALSIPVAGAIWFPDELEYYEALLWLLALVPAFLLAYQRGWTGAATALALGMAVLSLTYAGMTYQGKQIPETLFPVVIAYLAITLGLGWFGAALERSRAEVGTAETGWVDQETSLAAWTYARRYLVSEVEAARRGRLLTVVLFQLGETRGGRADVDTEALIAFADLLGRNTRKMNLSARHQPPHDSRFVSVLSGVDLEGASIFAQRVLARYRSEVGPEGEALSAGVAAYRRHMNDVDDVLEAVESALEEALAAGGDRVRALGTVVQTSDTAPEDGREGRVHVAVETTLKTRVAKALLVGQAELVQIGDALAEHGVETEYWDGLADGQPALSQVYDVVVIDLDHVANGLEVIRTARSRSNLTQCVIVAGQDSAAEAVALLNEGADRCLLRPCEEGEIRTVAAAVLARRDDLLRSHLEQEHIAGELGAREREARRALSESQQRYRKVVEGMQEVVFEISDEGRWSFLSEAWERLTGVSIEQALGQPVGSAFHAEDAELVEEELRRVLSGELSRMDVQVRLGTMPPGEERWIAMTGAVSTKTNGRPESGVLGTITDVTDRRQLEEQLRQAQKMEAVGQLAGGIAHDFNNLLMAIRGHAEFVANEADLDEELALDLQTVIRETQRGAGLTRQLLAFSSVHVPDLEVFDLGEAVAGMERMLHRLLDERVEIEIDLPADPLLIEADRAHVQQVVLNLATNARDAMPDGGVLRLGLQSVEVSASRVRQWGKELKPGRYARLTAKDTGLGMDPVTQSKVFDPFFTTKAPGKGTGLGMSTVFGIVSERAGHIEVRSEPGEGTEFLIYLPQSDLDATTDIRPEGGSLQGTNREGVVLVVEDDDGVRTVLKRYLAAAGYEVITAGSGSAVLKDMTAEQLDAIDLVVTDVVMPGLSGFELVDALRERRPGLEALFMSGYAEDELTGRGMKQPRSFLNKPFAREDLLTAVAAAFPAGTSIDISA